MMSIQKNKNSFRIFFTFFRSNFTPMRHVPPHQGTSVMESQIHQTKILVREILYLQVRLTPQVEGPQFPVDPALLQDQEPLVELGPTPQVVVPQLQMAPGLLQDQEGTVDPGVTHNWVQSWVYDQAPRIMNHRLLKLQLKEINLILIPSPLLNLKHFITTLKNKILFYLMIDVKFYLDLNLI